MTCVFLAIGSNLNNPLNQVIKALDNINKLPFTKIIAKSSFYRTPPYGVISQPDYLNAVVKLQTKLKIEIFFKYTKKIEIKHNNFFKKPKWGPRALDLDILIFGKLIINSSNLIIPHYDMHNRAFVLLPLIEINPNLILPNNKKIIDLIDKIDCSKINYWNN